MEKDLKIVYTLVVIGIAMICLGLIIGLNEVKIEANVEVGVINE